MRTIQSWWHNDLPKGVKLVFFILLANALPAITILMTLPTRTETLFVWTVAPVINARLMGVMYLNALLLVAIGMFQTSWPRVRIVMVVITLFSILATGLTFFFLKPFLAHPWFHLAFWLSMYLALVFSAPTIFIQQERQSGGRLAVLAPLSWAARLMAGLFLGVSAVVGLSLMFQLDWINQLWPWTLPPLVAGLIGVLLTTHAVAYAWALWDGDWHRTRPIFWQAPITGLAFLMLPLLHPADLSAQAGAASGAYLSLTGLAVLISLLLVISESARRAPAKPA